MTKLAIGMGALTVLAGFNSAARFFHMFYGVFLILANTNDETWLTTTILNTALQPFSHCLMQLTVNCTIT